MAELTVHGLGGASDPGTKRAIKRAAQGSAISTKFSAPELRSILADLKIKLVEGVDDGNGVRTREDFKIAEHLNVNITTYEQLKRELYRQETAALYNQSTEELYLEYAWKQQRCIQDLDGMIAFYQSSKQPGAVVQAVRTKSDILDKIIKTGQELGVLEKAVERKLVVHGFAVANLDNANLRQLIAKELEGLASVYQKYGDRDMMGNVIEAESTSLVASPPPAPKFSADGKPLSTRASSMNRAAAGRAGQAARREPKQE